jgi:hypothetical protein
MEKMRKEIKEETFRNYTIRATTENSLKATKEKRL